jgi:hypothetical protein
VEKNPVGEKSGENGEKIRFKVQATAIMLL